jgi:hypothetical protein
MNFVWKIHLSSSYYNNLNLNNMDLEIEDIRDTDEWTLYDEICRTELELEKFDDHVIKLWELVIVPYLESPNKLILEKLQTNDFNKFRKFMYESNAYKNLRNKLEYLYSLE